MNDDGFVDISDPIALIGWQFTGGAPPAAPFPGCGGDPTTADPLDCGNDPSCL